MDTWPSDAFAGKRVFVSGGTSGIGAAAARAFLAAGATVAVGGPGEAELAGAGEAEGLADAEPVMLDVRDGDRVAEVVPTLGPLDCVVNAAGVIRRGAEHMPEVFAEVVDVNLNGAMRVAAAARPLLADGAGSIVNVASMLAYFGSPFAPGYSASKGGIVQLTRSLAIAYAGDGIRVNAVAPGWIDTPLTAPVRDDPARNDALMARTALGRWGRPEEVANAILFLASPLAAFVTGSILDVDGGFSAM